MNEEDAACGGGEGMPAMRTSDVATEFGRVPAEFIDLEGAQATGIDTTLETHRSAVLREGEDAGTYSRVPERTVIPARFANAHDFANNQMALPCTLHCCYYPPSKQSWHACEETMRKGDRLLERLLGAV